jgi:arabinogalactan endo-1,4-beta-galactosidase
VAAHKKNAAVSPSSGWCNTDDLVAQAKRATAAGLGVMVDFHHSDVWAAPAHQTKPAARASQATSQLYKSVYDFTPTPLNTLKTAGATPTWGR